MVQELIQEFARRGIRLNVSEGRLLLSAPPGSLTDELKDSIRLHRDALIGELARVSSDAALHAFDPIVAEPHKAHLPFPLSDLQLGFYMANDPYMEFHVRPHCYMEIDRSGFDVARYQYAWNKALRRHALGFHRINAGLQLEKLAELPPFVIEVNDFRGLDSDRREAALLVIRQRLERRELPLDRWPWFDLSVSVWREDGEDKHRIHYNHNSFFIDGYATTQFLEEIERYYANPQLELPARVLSYRDAVLAIAALEFTVPGQQAKQYWLSRLPQLPPPPDLPQVATRERRCRSHLDRRAGVLSPQRWDAFKRHAQACKVTPSNAIIAAYAQVISAWSQSEHFIFSQMVTRRFAELHAEIKTLIGNFASLYPLEIRIDRSLAFQANASAVQDQVMRDIRHLHYGGMQVLQELNRLKGGFGTAPSPFVVGSGLFMKEYKKYDYVLLETSQTLLDHQFFELPDGSYYYVWDLIEAFFPDGLIDAMWGAFVHLLDALCDDPGAWTVPVRGLLDARELAPRERVNRSAQSFPESLLHAPLPQQARVQGERTAVRDAGRTLTWRELDACSTALAQRLQHRLAPGENRIAVAMPRCAEMVVAVCGVLKAGAAYVPVDPNLPANRRDFLLRDVGAPVVLTLPALRAQLDWPAGIEVIGLDLDAAAEDGGAPAASAPAVAPDRLAYVIYTSGTTGRPKGVMIEHAAAMNTVQDINRRFSVGADDRLFGVSPFNFDLSVYDIFGAIAAGATLVYPDVDAALDPLHWLDLIQAEQVTVWNSVPALVSLLVEAAQDRGTLLTSLRLVLLSGDKVPNNLAARIHAVAPQASVVALGGATEAAIWSIIFPLEKDRAPTPLVPYGYPMANQRWHIRDRHGENVPTWVPGELLIAGDGLARGYYGDAEKTARSFVVDTRSGERLYRTGDIGRYLPDGCIEIHGRIDHQVKIQGHRIELGEVEATLLRHPAVDQAVVLVRELTLRKAQQLVAYVRPSGVDSVSPAALEQFLREELPVYMIPQHWLLLAELPTTANGKVDRAALAAIAIDAAAQGAAPPPHVAPRTAVEQALATIWQDVLQVEAIGVYDDFFDLGGQSFDAIRIFTVIKNTYGRLFTLGDIWQARTVAAFAGKLLDGAADSASDPLVALAIDRPGRPLFLVHPAGGGVTGYRHLAQALSRPVYGLQALPRAEGGLPTQDVADLAAGYVAALLRVQPEGPYAVGGWSSGGAVAFEMVRQLVARGAAVEPLLLLDAPAPYRHADLSAGRLAAWFMEDLALGLPLQYLPAYAGDAGDSASALSWAIHNLQPYSPVELVHAQLLPIFRVFCDMVVAVSRYLPACLPSDMTIVRVTENSVSEFAAHPAKADADWGWGGFCSGSIRSVVTPGNHHDFLAPHRLPAWSHVIADGQS